MDGSVGEGSRRGEWERTSQKPIVEYSSGGTINAKNLYGKAIDEILMRTDPMVNCQRSLRIDP